MHLLPLALVLLMQRSDSVLSPSAPELARAALKLSYLGEQTKPVPTVVFQAPGASVRLQDFESYQRQPYGNDPLPYTKTVTASPQQLGAMLAAARPWLAEPTSAGTPLVSLVIAFAGSGGRVAGAEFLLSGVRGDHVYEALLAALGTANEPAREALQLQHRNVYPEIEVEGVALEKPVVRAEDGREYWLEGLAAWPGDLARGSRLNVRGRFALEGEGAARRFVLVAPAWRPLELGQWSSLGIGESGRLGGPARIRVSLVRIDYACKKPNPPRYFVEVQLGEGTQRETHTFVLSADVREKDRPEQLPWRGYLISVLPPHDQHLLIKAEPAAAKP